jgi:AcrR family transcriptional regulator
MGNEYAATVLNVKNQVKKRRPYHSPRRQEQAASTRTAILEAARRLFERHGYGPTSMAAIAAEADVAVKTVYLAFETKSGILRALWHLLLRGDESPMPVGERDWFLEVLAEADPERKLRLTARNSRAVKERAGDLMKVIRDAAAADPDVGALWQRIQSDFYANQRAIIESLHERHALPPDLAVDRGADILWTLNHPATYWLLSDARGWTPAQYEQWLGDSLCSQLLRAGAEDAA